MHKIWLSAFLCSFAINSILVQKKLTQSMEEDSNIFESIKTQTKFQILGDIHNKPLQERRAFQVETLWMPHCIKPRFVFCNSIIRCLPWMGGPQMGIKWLTYNRIRRQSHCQLDCFHRCRQLNSSVHLIQSHDDHLIQSHDDERQAGSQCLQTDAGL